MLKMLAGGKIRGWCVMCLMQVKRVKLGEVEW